MAVRRFEMVNDEHSKYWECSVKGTNFVVHYGRIGTDGQESVKEFESKDEAKEYLEKKVLEKTKDGYIETKVD